MFLSFILLSKYCKNGQNHILIGYKLKRGPLWSTHPYFALSSPIQVKVFFRFVPKLDPKVGNFLGRISDFLGIFRSLSLTYPTSSSSSPPLIF